MTSPKLHLWESALLTALALTLVAGLWSSASQSALASQVLRLHVVANSDSPSDQSLKLAVRDAVLAEAAPVLDGISDPVLAEQALLPHLDALAKTGQTVLAQAGCHDGVTVTLEDQWFPTRVYDSFSLPAGSYRALRVVIGEGEGQNWWCVVFPPLCLASVTEEVAAAAAEAGLTEDQVALITGQDGEYVLKFKLIEWWEEFVQKLKNRA